jgi:hypothetical protein
VGQPQHEAVRRQQPRPQQQGTFLAAPHGRKFVWAWQRAIGVLSDVRNGEVVSENGINQRERSGGDCDECGDPCAAGRVGQALWRNPRLLPGRQKAKRKHSREEVVRH